jgi:hypothetical protein
MNLRSWKDFGLILPVSGLVLALQLLSLLILRYFGLAPTFQEDIIVQFDLFVGTPNVRSFNLICSVLARCVLVRLRV